MKNYLWLLIFLISCDSVVLNPDLTNKFKEATYPIRSINISEENNSDLEVIGQDIGEAKLVMLGENDHGDGETFKAKARLVKYLHEQKGFNVLAFESDFIGVNSVWDIEKSSEKSLEEIFGIWRSMQEFQPMSAYLKSLDKTEKAMTIAGFDSQWYGKYSTSKFIPKFINVLKSIGYDDADPDFDKFMKLLVNSNDFRKYANVKEEEHLFLNNYLDSIRGKIDASSIANKEFWLQIVKSLKGNTADRWQNRRNPEQYKISQFKANYDHREAQMADNLLWLVYNKYKGEKIIVWAHNFHVSKNTQEVLDKNTIYPRTVTHTMGSLVHQALKDEVYILGFNSYDGTTTSPFQREGRRSSKIKNSNKDAFAAAANTLKIPYSFASFKQLNTSSSNIPNFIMRGWGYEYFLNGRWMLCYDGMFFIQKNKASTEF
jgi:erythromycin esterase